jgi:hypothetical protein
VVVSDSDAFVSGEIERVMVKNCGDYDSDGEDGGGNVVARERGLICELVRESQ